MSADIKYGPVYSFEKASFYAANGSIVFHDDREKAEGSCNVMSIDTMELRCAMMKQSLDALGFQHNPGAIEHKRKLSRLLRDMEECIKDAKIQGDPMSPEVQQWYKTHKPWKSRVSFVSTAGVASKGTDPVSYEIPMPESSVPHHTIGNRLIY